MTTKRSELGLELKHQLEGAFTGTTTAIEVHPEESGVIEIVVLSKGGTKIAWRYISNRTVRVWHLGTLDDAARAAVYYMAEQETQP